MDDAHRLIQGIRRGDRRLLARAITLIESTLPAHQEIAAAILDDLVDLTGKATRIGITGVPGVGKSTFIETFGLHLIGQGKTVAVLAVDPSSRVSGGSILADKTRMEVLATRKEAFIRPSPTGETLGGVARRTRESMLLCEAAGYEVILVETVGVGQSETAVAGMVDFFLVLMLTGAGDEIQGLKRGILELADAIAVTKADGSNLQAAEKTRETFAQAIHFLRPASPAWSPLVVTCSALEKTGIAELWQIVQNHRSRLQTVGEFEQKRRKQAIEWFWTLVEEGLKDRFQRNAEVKSLLPRLLDEVEEGRRTAPAAARTILDRLGA